MTIKVYGLHFDYLYKLNISTDVDFYVDTKEYHQNTNKKIYIQHEPSDISRLTNYLKDNAHLYDLIFCNILARPLIALAPELAKNLAPRGFAILSGLLVSQINAVVSAQRAHGLRVVEVIEKEEWAALVFKR